MRIKIKWYQILRALTPPAYTALLVGGYMSKTFLFMGILLGGTLLSGAWFCGWLCPLGFAQEWLGKLGRLLRIPRIRVPAAAVKWLNLTRYLLLALSFLGIAIVLLAQTPYASFMGLIDRNISYITNSAWIFLGVNLALSILVDRPFCRYLCPEGARYGILSLARLFSIRRRESSCVDCKKCDQKCPSQIAVSKTDHVRDGQCINCMECIATCPVKGTLDFGWTIKHRL